MSGARTTLRALLDPPSSPALGRALLGLWIAAQVVAVGWGVGTGRWPWAMFAAPDARVRRVYAEARAPEGDWEALPIDTLFHYARGFTDRTILDEARALRHVRGRGRRQQRADFARYAASELAPEAGYVEVHLWAEATDARTGRRIVTDLGTYPAGPP